MWARSPSSRRLRSSELRASPHSSRCLPSCQRSPNCVTAGPSRQLSSISSAGSSDPSSKSACSASISAGSKPVTEISRSSSTKSSGRAASSIASSSRSQPALRAIRLSARSSARFLASLSPEMTIAGMDDIPSDLAASSRPCPAMSILFSSIRIGAAKPTARMLAAICRICFFECVRAFLGWGLIWSMGTRVSALACASRSCSCTSISSKNQLSIDCVPSVSWSAPRAATGRSASGGLRGRAPRRRDSPCDGRAAHWRSAHLPRARAGSAPRCRRYTR